jgi:hypothetical protein
METKKAFSLSKTTRTSGPNAHLKKEISYLKVIKTLFLFLPHYVKVWRRTRKMIKKWPFHSDDMIINQKVCDLREAYGIEILTTEKRSIKKPLVWSGSNTPQ